MSTQLAEVGRRFAPQKTEHLLDIYGVDIKPRAKGLESERLRVFAGDQKDPAVLDAIVAESGPLDIVIDDGSHQPDDQQATLLRLWPSLKRGGLYVIEDIHTSYKSTSRYSSGWRQPGTTVEFLKNVLDDIHVHTHRREPILAGLDWVHVYFRTAILHKGIPVDAELWKRRHTSFAAAEQGREASGYDSRLA